MLRILLFLTLLLPLAAFELPGKTRQCVVGIADSWDASKVTLTIYEKRSGQWQAVLGPWPGRLGKSGLIWGRGLHPNPSGAKLKKEGDRRAPAGVFRIGGAWGYDASVRKHPKLFYRQITKRDLWVEDSKSEHYNRHLVLDHDPATAWEKKQQMRQGDHAHSLKLFIAHNAPPKVTPGAGSAIFFHIWRGGGSKPTAGCTTISEERLRQLIAWIDPAKEPVYVLLPKAEYGRYRADWQLP
jgi:L,D-peptidoglycan transpeptidase YkuD (ErfK/YbiS/YcfS/YnhG family)